MRTLPLLGLLLSIGALVGCSCPELRAAVHYQTKASIGALPIDFADGPHEVDLHMELIVEAPERMACEDLSPLFSLAWEGDEGDVRLRIATDSEVWDEDVPAASGVHLTWVRGAFDRCTFDATLWVDGDETMAGELVVEGMAQGGLVGIHSSRGVLVGEATVGLLPEDGTR